MAFGRDKMKSSMIAIFLIILSSGLFHYCFGQVITLKALEPVALVATLEDAYLTEHPQVIATIDTDSTLMVDSCEDVKHYMIPKVTLADGRQAFVATGKFQLTKVAGWSFAKGPRVFSC